MMRSLVGSGLIKSTDPKLVRSIYWINIYLFPAIAILFTALYAIFPNFDGFYYSNAPFHLPKLAIDEKNLMILGEEEFSKYYINYFNFLFILYGFFFIETIMLFIVSIFFKRDDVKKSEIERLWLGFILFVIMGGVLLIIPTEFVGLEGNKIMALPTRNASIYILLFLFIGINTLSVKLLLLISKYIKYIYQKQSGGRYG